MEYEKGALLEILKLAATPQIASLEIQLQQKFKLCNGVIGANKANVI
jgi:hypothetical protein